jgi:ribosomal protein L39E
MLVINKTDDIYEKLKEYVETLKITNKPIFVFDIHKTTLTKDNLVNEEIKYWIKKLIDENFNVFFLSYDGQEKRIKENNKLIKKEKLFRNIPAIFMMKRKKHQILLNLVKLINVDKDYKIKATLIDDNPLNIKDVDKLDKNIYSGILYKIKN